MSDKLMAEWFWTDRWMGSSAFLLPIEVRGLYREMLTQAWRRGARLPNDPVSVQRAVGVTKREWDRCWPKVQRYWTVEGDSLVNQTQRQIYAECLAKVQSDEERARKGGLAKAAKAAAQASAYAPAQAATQAQRQASSQAPAQAAPEQCSPDPDPDPDPINERNTSDRSPSDGRALWGRIIEELEISEKNKKEFFEPCEVYSYESGRLIINARKSFIGEWLNKHFWKRVREVAGAIEPGLRVELITKPLSVVAR